MSDHDLRCSQCGGPVGKDGRTLAPVASSPPRVAPVAPPVAVPKDDPSDDPSADLPAGERFARAIERRDALIGDRRTSEQRGRDTPLAGSTKPATIKYAERRRPKKDRRT
jgi:hypothetical protein